MTQRPILTSRSRIEAYLNCPRLGWLSYDWEGSGLSPIQAALPLATGIALHALFEQFLVAHPETPTDALISKVLATYETDVRARGVANEDPSGLDFLIAEQLTFLEGILRAWLSFRLPQLKREYDFLAIERDLAWELDPATATLPAILDLVKCDVVARRKLDGGLFYLDWKSTSTGGDDWAKGFEHNSQILANTLALEELLGERVEGVLIEGIIKGRRAVDKSARSPFYGRRIQQSPLCYGYRNDLSGECQTRYTSAKGWQKVASWQTLPIKIWVEEILTADDLGSLFASVPPIRPHPGQLARWRRQTIASERERAIKLEALREGASPDDCFPMNDAHCYRYWGHPCAFEALCFGAEVASDPLGSGLYERRIPHHPLEIKLRSAR